MVQQECYMGLCLLNHPQHMKVMKMPRNTRIAPKDQEAFFPLGAHKMHTAEDLGIYFKVYEHQHMHDY